jgi:excinuclease ABC subunit B
MASVIQNLNIPTLVMAPNKLLAAQLYQEFKEFFPENSVHYYISYFDYYQPEAYLPNTGTYIEKDSSVNDEIMKYRLASTHALLTRQDVIIVASVSCIYGIGNPTEWSRKSFTLEPGMKLNRRDLLQKLIGIHFERNDIEFMRGKIRVRGDVVDIFPGYLDSYYRVTFWGDEIESIFMMDPITNNKIQEMPNLKIFPTREYVTFDELIPVIVEEIKDELEEILISLKSEQKWAEAQRLEERVNYDMEMLKEVGFCNGIENYSRFLDRRKPGEQPACLYDYFPENFLLIMDESHIGVPQIRGMIKGDQARKRNLVDYGFRLPSALDNRPLKFAEWEKMVSHAVFTSATPGPYELKACNNKWVDMVVRPTGLIDPSVEIRPVENQIDDLLEEIQKEIEKGNRVLVTTLTKKMAENISEYFKDLGIKIEYLHSDIDTVERMDLIRQLRQGIFDVIIGINLLREGLDLPEVGLVAILDGDKQGFLRDTRSLIQTIGRASRNVNGRALIYAAKETDAIKNAIKETDRRRDKQIAYNTANNITPQTIRKRVQDSLATSQEQEPIQSFHKVLHDNLEKNMNEEEIIQDLEHAMLEAAKSLEFEQAADLRDLIRDLKTGKKSLSQLKEIILAKSIQEENTENLSEDPTTNISGFQVMGSPERISSENIKEMRSRSRKDRRYRLRKK